MVPFLSPSFDLHRLCKTENVHLTSSTPGNSEPTFCVAAMDSWEVTELRCDWPLADEAEALTGHRLQIIGSMYMPGLETSWFVSPAPFHQSAHGGKGGRELTGTWSPSGWGYCATMKEDKVLHVLKGMKASILCLREENTPLMGMICLIPDHQWEVDSGYPPRDSSLLRGVRITAVFTFWIEKRSQEILI